METAPACGVDSKLVTWGRAQRAQILVERGASFEEACKRPMGDVAWGLAHPEEMTGAYE